MTTNFGRDISCTTSLRTGRFVSGVRLVAEAAFRRLITPRGTLRGSEEEDHYGFDLKGRIGAIASDADAASLPGQIEGELRKDERIESVSTTVIASKDGPATTYEIAIDAVTADGPFSLQLAASAVTVELLGIKAEG